MAPQLNTLIVSQTATPPRADHGAPNENEWGTAWSAIPDDPSVIMANPMVKRWDVLQAGRRTNYFGMHTGSVVGNCDAINAPAIWHPVIRLALWPSPFDKRGAGEERRSLGRLPKAVLARARWSSAHVRRYHSHGWPYILFRLKSSLFVLLHKVHFKDIIVFLATR